MKLLRAKPKTKEITLYDDEANTLKENVLKSLHIYELTGPIQDREIMVKKRKPMI